MVEGRKFFQLLSTVERKHGLSSIDPPAREILDLIIERELADQKTTASDLIENASISRAAVYRKLNDLKEDGWIEERWIDHKLCYMIGSRTNKFSVDLAKMLKE